MVEVKINITGHCTVLHYASEEDFKNGILKDKREFDNLLLTLGADIAADRLGDTNAQAKLQCIASGDDNTAPAVGQTDLQGIEHAFLAATPSKHADTGKERFTATFAAGVGTGTWKEAVLADEVTSKAAATRVCFSRVTFGDIVKGAGEVITWIWDITFL